MNTPEPDPRVAVMKKLVRWLSVFVVLSILVASVFGVYNCATDRPAREIFLDPADPPEPG